MRAAFIPNLITLVVTSSQARIDTMPAARMQDYKRAPTHCMIPTLAIENVDFIGVSPEGSVCDFSHFTNR
jgi:hypothetical protein